MPSRRKFLTSLAGASAGSARVEAYLFQTSCTALLSPRSLAAYCASLSCAPWICLECLQALPSREGSSDRLASLILGGLPQSQDSSASPFALSKLIREASQSDFADGRVLNVDGWMLSITEARVYALAGLIRK